MKILVVDDSAILREGLAALLTGRGHDVDTARTGDDAIAATDRGGAHGFDVVVMDIRMPPTHTDEGVRAAVSIKALRPDVGVLLFSQYAEVHWARMLLEVATSGVGYLLKDRVADVGGFIDSLQQITAGNVVLDPEVAAALVNTPRTTDSDVAQLSPRERDVLRLMAEGRSNGAIATAMFLSNGTVEKHITTVFNKLGLETSPSSHRRVLAVLRYLST
ncbi:response regulator transcription factor [Rhodococcoides yunnanense]|jgi:DNA-binding NarL/FixJ family response regulator|uniref:response regulator transcription factor n=1 Tax=Rhodococcoides yunnanense TaxID=278209 RepID=UPI0022B0E691|nr:response regulator transcription factor [Rhodococcus yunnanensis]MCZ4278449.1 response regulator transcription factor [Rhodococcus yunnanensis]